MTTGRSRWRPVAGLAVLALAAPAAGASRGDLAVLDVSTGGLCVGPANRIEVTVTNLGDVIVDPGVETVLTVQTPGHAPESHTAIAAAIAPGQRLLLRFDRIEVRQPADVLLRVEVDPARRVDDPDRRNNTAAVLEAATEPCGPGAAAVAGVLSGRRRTPRCPAITRNVAFPGDGHQLGAAIHS